MADQQTEIVRLTPDELDLLEIGWVERDFTGIRLAVARIVADRLAAALDEWVEDQICACGHGVTCQECQLARVAAARADERERIVKALERERNEHWQEHLNLHPLAQGSSDPRCYAIHDALALAVNVARGVTADPKEVGRG